MTAALRVIAPGLMTTLQDLGRRGYQHLGVPVSGALDPVCLQAANLLAGNAPGMGALEIAYQGPTLAVEADSVRIAAAGGQAAIDILAPTAAAAAAPCPLRERAPRARADRQDRRACRAAPSSISRSRAGSPLRRSWAASRRSRAAASAASRAARCRPATCSRCGRRRRPSARR